MATGASTAELAIILIDARNGVLPQSRRHAFIANLLGIRHFVVAINKMDLVDFDQDVYNAIRDEFTAFLRRIGAPDALFIPISARDGDNVVTKSGRDALVRGARRCSNTSKTCPSKSYRKTCRRAFRCSMCCGRTWISAVMRDRSLPACFARAIWCWRCPRGAIRASSASLLTTAI